MEVFSYVIDGFMLELEISETLRMKNSYISLKKLAVTLQNFHGEIRDRKRLLIWAHKVYFCGESEK